MPDKQTSNRKTLLERIAARNATQIWGPFLPVANHLPPALLARFAKLLSPEDFARGVAAASDEQLAAAMATKLRDVVLAEVVRRMQDEFIPSRASDLDAVIQFKIGGRPDGGSDVFQLRIADSRCSSAAGQAFTAEPTSNIELDAVDFLKLATGIVSGVDLYLSGKLKWDGGMMMLTRLTRMFNIPEPPAQAAAA